MNSLLLVVLVCVPLIFTRLVFAGISYAKPDDEAEEDLIRPGHSEWPMAWTSYRTVNSLEEDIKDLKSHGVGLISQNARNVEKAEEILEVARRTGMKYHISLPDITEHIDLVKDAGLKPVRAQMIGGVYRGKAIDRHLLTFTADKHEIVIEPPVYNRGFAYTRGSGGTGRPRDTEKIAHYFPDIGAPVKAEVIVPLKPFDGQQHLKIIPASITEAPADTKLDVDSVTPDMPESNEIRNRKLYQIAFDLTGLDDAMLDHVGLAVYWEYGGTGQYWMFGRGNVSAWASSTQEALRMQVRQVLQRWIDANGGSFPHDVVLAARFGDECFYVTSHLDGLAVNYPLWEYSHVSIEVFHDRAGDIEYPRTWGFPEIYGSDAYAWWMYILHEGCARLCGVVREEIASIAPGLLLFRNQTRAGVFALTNDHDGSGQELLARNLDIVHLDPYPVNARRYGQNIPRDMSYCAGLSRRYNRLLIPWMQAHTYGGPGGLQDVSPEQVERMSEEQMNQGVDAIMWLGYGNTFPEVRPDSWEQAGEFHKRLAASPPAKPRARLAVIRPYRAWAASSRWEGNVRNPADWLLQQLLEVWAVKHGRPYDVSEIPPALSSSERKGLEEAWKSYPFLVSTEPYEGAWVIGVGTENTIVDPSTAREVRDQFERELNARGWLKSGRWQIGAPIVTYWAGPPMTDAVAKQMAEGNWNLVWCSEGDLDVAHQHSLRALLQDSLLRPASLDQPDAKAKLDALIERVRNHPALYAYSITDEPSVSAFPELGRLTEYLSARDPSHTWYINLYPIYANNQQLGTIGDPVPAYQEHLRQYVEILKPDLISYDHYHFTVKGDGTQYFMNLAMIRQAALDAGVPFMNIVQACSWTPSMRIPNGDELRWLVYTSLAYGAQGISYYVYCHPNHEGAMATADGTPTPLYHAARIANRDFAAIASELQPLRSLGAYHVGMMPPGTLPLPDDAVFQLDPPVPARDYAPPQPVEGFLLGYFGKADSPTYTLVVNLDYRQSATRTIVGPDLLEVFDAATGKWSAAGANRMELCLQPGGGALVRVVR